MPHEKTLHDQIEKFDFTPKLEIIAHRLVESALFDEELEMDQISYIVSSVLGDFSHEINCMFDEAVEDDKYLSLYRRDEISIGYLLSLLINSEDLKTIISQLNTDSKSQVKEQLLLYLHAQWNKAMRKRESEFSYVKFLESKLNFGTIPSIGFEIEYHSKYGEKVYEQEEKSIRFPFEVEHDKEVSTKPSIQVGTQIREFLQLVEQTGIDTASMHLTVSGVSADMMQEFMYLRLFCDAANFMPRRKLHKSPIKLQRMKRGEKILSERYTKTSYGDDDWAEYSYHMRRESHDVDAYLPSLELGTVEVRSFSKVNLKKDWIGLVRTLDFYNIAKFAVAAKSQSTKRKRFFSPTKTEKDLVNIWDRFISDFRQLFLTKGVPLPEFNVHEVRRVTDGYTMIHNQAVGYGMTDKEFSQHARRLITQFKKDVTDILPRRSSPIEKKSRFVSINSKIQSLLIA